MQYNDFITDFLTETSRYLNLGKKPASKTKVSPELENQLSQSALVKIGSESNADEIWCRFDYTIGNSKVGKNTLIFNMGAAKDCPSAKAGLCDLYSRGLCYAQNDETQYVKSALPFRRRQGNLWKALTAQELSVAFKIIVASRKKIPVRYIRFNESGDFSGQDDVEKLGTIADLMPNIKFYTYTHRSDLNFDSLKARNNVVIQGSGLLKNGEPFMLDNNFNAYNYYSMIAIMENNPIMPVPDNFKICMGDCYVCPHCKSKGGSLIGVLIHGRGAKVTSEASLLSKMIKKMIAENNGTLPDLVIKRLFLAAYNNEITLLDMLFDKNKGYLANDKITKDEGIRTFIRRRELDKTIREQNPRDISMKALATATDDILKNKGFSEADIKKANEVNSIENFDINKMKMYSPELAKIESDKMAEAEAKRMQANESFCLYESVIEEKKEKEENNIQSLTSKALDGSLRSEDYYVSENTFKSMVTRIIEYGRIFFSNTLSIGKKLAGSLHKVFTK